MTAAPVRSTGGIAAGEHIERSLILDLALAEDRRRDIVHKTRNGSNPPPGKAAPAAVPASSTPTNGARSWPAAPEGQSLREISRVLRRPQIRGTA
jgi:hypothetical protein